jgi:hypothetical protein
VAVLRFSSPIRIIGVNPYVLVDAEKVSKLKEGWRRPMPVTFQVIGKHDETWRVNLMPVGDGTFRLYLNGDIREATGVGVGDMATFEVQFDRAYRNGPLHPIPPWFKDKLERNRLAKRGWERLTPSRQKEILRYFARLKSPEAKERNLRRALSALSGDSVRFMGRLWDEKAR